ncbi:MAG: hypothetical protein WDO24_24100 [Pseudomonadota bacterium]
MALFKVELVVGATIRSKAWTSMVTAADTDCWETSSAMVAIMPQLADGLAPEMVLTSLLLEVRLLLGVMFATRSWLTIELIWLTAAAGEIEEVDIQISPLGRIDRGVGTRELLTLVGA